MVLIARRYVKLLILMGMLALRKGSAYAQATFLSNGTGGGRFENASSWQLITGSDVDGIPDSNDNVTILSGDDIEVRNALEQVNNLILIGSLSFDRNETLRVNGNFTASGTSPVLIGDQGNTTLEVLGTSTINSSTTLTIQKQSLTFNGLTTIDGTLTFDDDDGDYVFGDVTVSTTGTWNNTDRGNFSIGGNLTSNGVVTACSNTTCIYAFTSTTGQIGGSAAISLPVIELNSPASVTNLTDLSVTNDLTGSGDFVNGNGVKLRLKAGVALDELTYDFSIASNDLVFEGDSDVDLPVGTYHNVEVSFVDDRKTLNMDANVTINNDLILTDGKIEADAGSVINVGGDLIIGANSDEFKVKNSTFTVSANVDMDGGTIKTDDANTLFTVEGNADTSAGVLELKKGTTNIDGDLNVGGGSFSQGGNRGADSADLTVGGETNFTTYWSIAFTQGNIQTVDFTVGSAAQIDLGELVAFNSTGQAIVEGQIIFEDGANTPDWSFADLTLNSSSDLVLTNMISISGVLNLVDGNLELGNSNVELLDGATITGGSSSSFIVVNGSGVIRQFYTASGVTLNFPLGSAGYSPITALTINSASFVGGDYLDISLTESPHPNRSTANTPNGDDDGTAATDFINQFWTISANGISNPSYDVSAVYLNADVVGTEANLVGTLYRIPQGESFLDWFETGTVNAATNTITISGADNWGDVYAMDNDLSRLPVELVSFRTSIENGRVILRWHTASEENNDRFIIERSTDGNDWLKLGEVIGVGSTASTTRYEFVDAFPEVGKDYYRLRQVDFSGEFTYSPIELVDFRPIANKTERLRLVKNPVSVGEPLRFISSLDDSDGEYQLMKINGQQLSKGSLNELLNGTIRLNQSGLYVLNIIIGGKRQAIKILVL